MSSTKLRKGEYGEFYDEKGRVCDAAGTPLRNASRRSITEIDAEGRTTTFTGVGVPFRGLKGKVHRKGAAKLARRIKRFEDEDNGKIPYSNNFDRHRPGSLQFG